jgi:large subunit ribosomal protein L6
MSRIGKKEIKIPKSVTVTLNDDNLVQVKGPKGELSQKISDLITVTIGDESVSVARTDEKNRDSLPLYGLSRTLVANMIHGVSETFERKLELKGVGYRASLSGKNLILNVGYSHPVEIVPPQNTQFAVDGSTNVTVSGIDNSVVGQISAKIRSVRPPEPYKGKGIRYVGEYVKRKVGKSGKK